jgi:hypothetical protein
MSIIRAEIVGNTCTALGITARADMRNSISSMTLGAVLAKR